MPDPYSEQQQAVWQRHYERWNAVNAARRRQREAAFAPFRERQAQLDQRLGSRGRMEQPSGDDEHARAGKLRTLRMAARVGATLAQVGGKPAMGQFLREVGDTANAAALGAAIGAEKGLTGGALRAFSGNQAGGFAARRARNRGMGGTKAAALGGAVAGALGGAAKDPARIAKNAVRWMIRRFMFKGLMNYISYIPALIVLDIDYIRTRSNPDPLSKFGIKQGFYLILANVAFFLGLLLVFGLIITVVIIIVIMIQQAQNIMPGI